MINSRENQFIVRWVSAVDYEGAKAYKLKNFHDDWRISRAPGVKKFSNKQTEKLDVSAIQ